MLRGFKGFGNQNKNWLLPTTGNPLCSTALSGLGEQGELPNGQLYRQIDTQFKVNML